MKYNTNWKPVSESGEETQFFFDKRFEIDRIYMFTSIFKKYRIRFVKYPDDTKITVSILSVIKIPKWFSKIQEKYMLNFSLLFSDEKYMMTPNEILAKFNYSI